jgi:guanylate kinase
MLNEANSSLNGENASGAARGMLIVVSSPSGGGKGTLIDRVLRTVPGIGYSVSFTTRAPRGTEQNGREYFFVDQPTFEAMIERGEFLEWANVYGHLYGTHCAQVEKERATGRDVILEIDVQGAASIRRKIPDAVSIFILPPSFELLRERLVHRATDSAADLERRLRGAASEVEQYAHFQYVILNDDVNRASQQLASVIYAERARCDRQKVNLHNALEDFGVFSAETAEPQTVANSDIQSVAE